LTTSLSEDSKDPEDKSFEPTQQQLKKAYDEGKAPVSQDVVHWFSFLSIAMVMLYVMPHFLHKLAQHLSLFFGMHGFNHHSLAVLKQSFWGVIGVIMSLCILPIMINLSQSYKGITSKNIGLKWDKLSISKGIKRIISSQNFINLIKNIFKIIAIAAGIVIAIYEKFYHIDDWMYTQPMGALRICQKLLVIIFGVILAIYFLIAIFDFWYQNYTFIKNLRMSHEEVKKEFKESEGDPHIKGKRRQMAQELLRKNVKKSVEESAFVVVNPTHYAVSIQWDDMKMDTPLVLVKGKNHRAAVIKDIARILHIPVVRNPQLARSLYDQVDENHEILPEHYKAVAHIIQAIVSKKNHRL
jgi:flagellar biosynthetic protein FlhB